MNKYLKTQSFEGYKYFIYARKSSESEDRQVASIKDQINVMIDISKDMQLKVIDEPLSEASSGFHTGRKVFNEMLDRITNKEADGILVWKLSRLARNPDDAGRIMGMIQRGEIKHIRTMDRNWLPEDNVMMMYVEFAMTNQFSRDLKDDTTRGLIKKAERGWCPKGTLPLGYIHTPYKKLGEIEIMIDSSRFNTVSKALKKVASGEFTPLEGLEYANELGLTTKKGELVSESVFYRMLSNPFYYGSFEYPQKSGNWYEGKHEKAITKKEFELINIYRGHKDRPRPQVYIFPYTGMMKCGECGCSIVVDPKVKVQKNGNVHEYLYYRCTKSKGNCSQKYLEVTKLEKQLAELIDSITIPEVFHEWALEKLKKEQGKEIKDRNQVLDIAETGYKETLGKIDVLVKGWLNKKVPEDAYDSNLKELEAQKKKYKNMLDNTDDRVKEWTDKAQKVFDLAKDAKVRFENAEPRDKNMILLNIGANFTIKDLTLSLEIDRPLQIIQKAKPQIDKINKRFEPAQSETGKEEMKVFMSKNPTWGPFWDEIRNFLTELLRVDLIEII